MDTGILSSGQDRQIEKTSKATPAPMKKLPKQHLLRWALLPVLACVAAQSWASEQPLWEVGIGVAPVTFPNYRGSASSRSYILPLPYFIYRGDRLQMDRDGARGVLFERPGFKIDLSADGGVPVASDDDGARAGMADLDPVFEIGPSLNWLVHRSGVGRLQLRLPIRAAIASDLRSADHVGWTVQPTLNFKAPALVGGWDMGFNVGPKFASRRNHGYYYDVGGRDARDDRPAYRASAGYSGTALAVSASQRKGRLWAGVFVRYEFLDGATFLDSPLVETRRALTAGLGIAWIFSQSSRQVSVHTE